MNKTINAYNYIIGVGYTILVNNKHDSRLNMYGMVRAEDCVFVVPHICWFIYQSSWKHYMIFSFYIVANDVVCLHSFRNMAGNNYYC